MAYTVLDTGLDLVVFVWHQSLGTQRSLAPKGECDLVAEVVEEVRIQAVVEAVEGVGRRCIVVVQKGVVVGQVR